MSVGSEGGTSRCRRKMPVRAYGKGLVQQMFRDITLMKEEFNKKTIICTDFSLLAVCCTNWYFSRQPASRI